MRSRARARRLLHCRLRSPSGNTPRPLTICPIRIAATPTGGRLPDGMKWAAVSAPGPVQTAHLRRPSLLREFLRRTRRAADLRVRPVGQVLKELGRGCSSFRTASRGREGNIWVTDAQAADGKGHQVFKFSRDGKLLMTLGKRAARGTGPTRSTSRPTWSSRRTATSSSPTATVIGRERPRREILEGRKVHQGVGQAGIGPGDFNVPHTIAIDSRGRLSSAIAPTTASRSSIRTASSSTSGRSSAVRAGSSSTQRRQHLRRRFGVGQTPKTTGWKRGIRIGSARDGSVKYFIEDIESRPPSTAGPRASASIATGQCLRRRRPPADARETHPSQR